MIMQTKEKFGCSCCDCCCVPPNPNFRHVTMIITHLLPRMHTGIDNCFAKSSRWIVNNDINLGVLSNHLACSFPLSMVLRCALSVLWGRIDLRYLRLQTLYCFSFRSHVFLYYNDFTVCNWTLLLTNHQHAKWSPGNSSFGAWCLTTITRETRSITNGRRQRLTIQQCDSMNASTDPSQSERLELQTQRRAR